MPGLITPYCGRPPIPGSEVWNLDPILITCLAVLIGGHLWLIRSGAPWRMNAALAGWTVITLALISPLCNLSVALFTARVGQHMIIALIGAPLVALGLPRRKAAVSELWLATAVFGLMLWLWHAPVPYEATFASWAVYWMMHVTLFASALWLWSALFSTHGKIWPALGASFLTTMHMSLLGALLTFSPHPLFAVHFLTTAAWDLSPLEDQQIGGLIMWIPAGVLLMTYALVAFGRELAQLDRRRATLAAYPVVVTLPAGGGSTRRRRRPELRVV